MSSPHLIPNRNALSQPWVRGLMVALALGLTAWVDFKTGYEVSVFLLYTLPIALATVFFGVAGGLVTVLLSTALWMGMDHLAGHHYSHLWIWFVNAANRMVCFGLVVGVVTLVRFSRSVHARRFLHLSGRVPVCTQCSRLGAKDGYWRQGDAYLQEFAGVQPLSKVCPDCARHGYVRAGYREAAQ
ncbi:MAG TPA: hypothetical protein VFM48_03890 [Aquabacterium sp.]|nr:hypothetical protein [Aquabacterium sp.]